MRELVAADDFAKLIEVISVASVFYFLHTVSRDNQSIVAVFAILSMVLLRFRDPQFGRLQSGLAQLAPLALLAAYCALTTWMSGGSASGLRMWALVMVVFLLGLTLGTVIRLQQLLWGLILGAFLTQIYGWSSFLSTWELGVTVSDYSGVSNLESVEALSVLVGLTAAAALGRQSVSGVFGLFLAGCLLLFSLVSLGMTSLIIVAAVILVAALYLLIIRRAKSPSFARFLGLVAIFAWGSSVLAVFQGTLLKWIAVGLGEVASISIRYELWSAVISSSSPMQLWFGNGAAFWLPDSPSFKNFSETMEAAGLATYGHAHSSYVDLFVNFGVLGVIAVGIISWQILQPAWKRLRFASSWQESSFLWLFVVAGAAFGFTESALIARPIGWLTAGLVLGASLVSEIPSKGSPR